jgi:ribonuclease BN (tRNA processing enzyme)
MSGDFSVTFYGCRGSLPVSGAEYVKYGGCTSCVVVQAGERTIVLDAGSGITNYGRQVTPNPKTGELDVYLFFSHVHFDHILGLPYFPPVYRPDATVWFWGPRNSWDGSFADTMKNIIRPPYHPLPMFEMLAKKNFHDIGEMDVVYFLRNEKDPLMARPAHPAESNKLPAAEDVDVTVQCMRGYNHPKSGVNIYRITYAGRSVVYATDTEGYVTGDQRLIHFAKNTDLLIHDAMYTQDRYTSMPVPTQGYGHSTVEIAATTAKQASVEKLVLFHHDPLSTDEDLDNVGRVGAALFENTVVGREGLVIHV